ncbi:MAG TPA: right-handed parallel beta-helix repeat-containing protein [Leeuwenhoekiella sp.]|nr:right-handed parallel beta-helix repeat-containing protein [Leeuwenhoekiella sp.]
MKKIITLLIALTLLSCGNPTPNPSRGDGDKTIDTVIPPPPKPVDSVPVVDTIPPPPPPVVEDTIIPQKPVYAIYTLDADAYGIIQGKVTDAQALANRYALEEAIQDAAEKQVDTFKIGVFDGYFDVSTVTSQTNKNFYPWVEGINIPSDFNLVMSDSTYLRVQPNNSPRYSLFSLYFSDNTYIEGGHLIGEREFHTWSGSGSDEWGHLIDINSSQNVTINGVEAKRGNGDGLVVHSREFSFKENYVPAKNVLIINCKIIENRRQGISITDGQDIIVEDNYFEGTGTTVGNSEGTNPRFDIDIEPYRERSKETGEIIWYEWVENVTLRGNKSIGSDKGSFIVAGGKNILIENNHVAQGMGNKASEGVVIRNNVCENYDENYTILPGIFAGDGTEVYGNTINGFSHSVHLSGENVEFHDNEARDFRSAGLYHRYNLKNSRIENNTFISNSPKAYAMFLHLATIENTEIINNTFESVRSALKTVSVNEGNDYTFMIEDNEFKSRDRNTVFKSSGIKFVGNHFNNQLEFKESTDIEVEQNTIESTTDAIVFKEDVGTISIIGNKLITGGKCTEAKFDPANLIEHSNECIYQ